MKKILRIYLAILAKILIKIKKPYIIGVTGSAGKTTISSFVIQFLQKEFGEENIGYSKYHYNGEFGLPLTVIGAKTGGKNIFVWMGVFTIFLKKIFTKYPKFLVLEYGIDTPKEMDFLLSIAIPDIAIISPIVANHIQQFGSEEAYRNEKLKILKARKTLIHDSIFPHIAKNSENIIFFGKNQNISSLLVKNIFSSPEGISGKICIENNDYDAKIPIFGEYQMENILPLFGIAKILNIPFQNLLNAMKNFHTESGRNMILKGKNNSIVIDGTYNGGFLAMTEGMQSVKKISENKKIILFLGDMRELGAEEEKFHKNLAEYILKNFENSESEIILVGNIMQTVVFPILKEKISTHHFLSSQEAGKKIFEIIKNSKKNAIIFAKGSQNTIFLEEGLKEFLEEKSFSHLCRQSKEWLEKKEKFFKSL